MITTWTTQTEIQGLSLAGGKSGNHRAGRRDDCAFGGQGNQSAARFVVTDESFDPVFLEHESTNVRRWIGQFPAEENGVVGV